MRRTTRSNGVANNLTQPTGKVGGGSWDHNVAATGSKPSDSANRLSGQSACGEFLTLGLSCIHGDFLSQPTGFWIVTTNMNAHRFVGEEVHEPW